LWPLLNYAAAIVLTIAVMSPMAIAAKLRASSKDRKLIRGGPSASATAIAWKRNMPSATNDAKHTYIMAVIVSPAVGCSFHHIQSRPSLRP
jgi:hypothetical protein